MTIPTSRDSDRFMLRLPEGMRDKIKASATDHGRSMNAEIIARLEHSFAEGDDETVADLKKRLSTITEIIQQHEDDVRQIYEKPHEG